MLARKKIYRHLACKVCRNLFNDLRVLRCGHSFCYQCLVSRLNLEKGKLSCPQCQVTYVASQPHSFVINSVIKSMCDEQSEAVQQSQKAKELRNKKQNRLLYNHYIC